MFDHADLAITLLDDVEAFWNRARLQDLLAHLERLALELVRNRQHREKFDAAEDANHLNEVQSLLHFLVLLVACQGVQFMLVDRKNETALLGKGIVLLHLKFSQSRFLDIVTYEGNVVRYFTENLTIKEHFAVHVNVWTPDLLAC